MQLMSWKTELKESFKIVFQKKRRKEKRKEGRKKKKEGRVTLRFIETRYKKNCRYRTENKKKTIIKEIRKEYFP